MFVNGSWRTCTSDLPYLATLMKTGKATIELQNDRSECLFP
jgi:hypothetical protein